MNLIEAEAVARILGAFGFPLAVTMFVAVVWRVRDLLAKAIDALRQRDETLQQALAQHVHESGKRLALLEQLITRHDRNIEQIWERLDVVRPTSRRTRLEDEGI